AQGDVHLRRGGVEERAESFVTAVRGCADRVLLDGVGREQREPTLTVLVGFGLAVAIDDVAHVLGSGHVAEATSGPEKTSGRFGVVDRAVAPERVERRPEL